MIHKTESEKHYFEHLNDQQEALILRMRAACKKIAPLWPLENFVAVNPYLGFTEKPFEDTAQELSLAGGIQSTLPKEFYLQKIEEGIITEEDIENALFKNLAKTSAQEFLKKLNSTTGETEEPAILGTVSDSATLVTNKDWNRFMTARISQWASVYFDQGQTIWSSADKQKSLFLAWKKEAEIDPTPELTGLKDFRKKVKSFSNNPLLASQKALEILGFKNQEPSEFYLHRLLLRLGGWSAHIARLDWDSKLYGGKDGRLLEFMSVLLCWEASLLECLNDPEIHRQWNEVKELGSLQNELKLVNQNLSENLVLQEAFDLANQRQLINKFKTEPKSEPIKNQQGKAQAVFCIDVRSEVFRRNLEMVDHEIETLGFAGFFAFPINYVPIGHEKGEAQCPVLLKTGPTILEKIPEEKAFQKAVKSRILNHQIQQVWKSFKSGAVSCFSFVSSMGISFLPKIFTDSFGLTRPVPHPDKAGLSDQNFKKRTISLSSDYDSNGTLGIPLEQQIQMAKNALKAMSLADDFARFVLIVGHGSSTVNNPHATGYDCGACGGHTGEANAKVVAAVLNTREVRTGLLQENIYIPINTTFLACLHDTTTDEVTIFNEEQVPAERAEEIEGIKKSLLKAGKAARTERSIRMAIPTDSADAMIKFKSKDWSEIRPEWGLAGCSAFVVANRKRTKNINLEGKSFLHSYDWKKDEGFSILELIMTAPMVVTSWINLQYFGSTVDNQNFGSGNKTLHNVTSGIGVLEGFSGDLRVGLPLQSIHDGENYQHEPNRLQVIIEAPIDTINSILEKHPSVKNLCDNGWIYLLAMDDEGLISHRYSGDLIWEKLIQKAA